MTKLVGSPFSLTMKESHPVISRQLTCENGDSISFTVTLPQDKSATIGDMHRKSVERVISLLQEWIKP